MSIFTKLFKKNTTKVSVTFEKGEITEYTNIKTGLFLYDGVVWYKAPNRGAVSLKSGMRFIDYIDEENKSKGQATTLLTEVAKVKVQILK